MRFPWYSLCVDWPHPARGGGRLAASAARRSGHLSTNRAKSLTVVCMNRRFGSSLRSHRTLSAQPTSEPKTKIANETPNQIASMMWQRALVVR